MAKATAGLTNPFGELARLPGMRQLLVLAGLALSVSIGVTAAFWMRDPGYTPLFTSLTAKESGEVINTLTAAGIPYRLDNNTGGVLVPGEQVYQARLKLAEQGLPKSAGFGLEIIEGEAGLGTSQFIEGARYHHAMETELGRTIASLQPVQSARVHLAVPKSTVFLGKKQPPTASVLLQLYPGRSLEQNQVSAIVHLVASSIPELEATRVTVVDQRGRLLNSPDDAGDMALSARQLDYLRRIEDGYVERIEGLLAPMLGPGRVRATVTADVDFAEREETQESFDPATTAVRSEQVAEDRRVGDGLAGGIPGALSNQPPPTVVQPAPQGGAAAAAAVAAAPADAAAATGADAATVAAGPVNESIRRTRNFEVDRTLTHTRQAVGSIRRLSVAVLVDEKRTAAADGTVTSARLSPEDLTELTRLVKDAVGFNEARGDSVSLSNVAFYQEPDAGAADEPGLLADPAVQSLGRQGLAAALIIGVALLLVRPLLKALAGSGPSSPALTGAAGPATGAAAYAAAGPAALGQTGGALSYDDKVSVARQLADRNPERVAAIVRQWVQADD
ncbi:MAG: flagellar M-ring protein FliF [Chromatiales bacterium]|nr:flagellar M-ring protein FliF [Chromatiales bacterium]